MSTTLLFFGALIASTVSEGNNGQYKGPPVVPIILPGGFLADTKEVAAAKEYFLNALAKTAAEVKHESPSDIYNTGTYQVPQPLYQQPITPLYQQPVTPRYQVPPQPAVPVYQAQSQQYTHTQPQSQSAPLYVPQVAYNPTPVNEGQNYDDGEYRQEYQYISNSPSPGPQVIPIILENGYIADTSEVNEAKANHFAAVAKAQEAVARAQERSKSPVPQQYSTVYQAAGSTPALSQQGYSQY